MLYAMAIVFACWYTAVVVAMLLACSGKLEAGPGLSHVCAACSSYSPGDLGRWLA